MMFHTYYLRLFVFLVFLILNSLAWADCQLDQVPSPIRNWIAIEQTTMSPGYRTRNTTHLTVNNNNQDPQFRPENQKIFHLKSYWIPEEKVFAFLGQGASPILPIIRMYLDQVPHYRLFVHPESEKFYEPFVQNQREAEPLCATPTSSSRTLLIWKEDQSIPPFLGKLSLDKTMGGMHRLIPSAEVVSSVGMSEILHSSQNSLPKDFSYFPEVFGLILKNYREGGMIIRLIPHEIASGKQTIIPFYSLYGKQKNGDEPLLISMLRKTKQSAKNYLRSQLIAPFARQWIHLAMKHGFVPEAHGQNTLLEIDNLELLTGNFVFRDLDGFALDLQFRKKMNLPEPVSMPVFTSIKEDYDQSENKIAHWTHHSINWFTSTLNHLNIELLDWMKRGEIPPEVLDSNSLE